MTLGSLPALSSLECCLFLDIDGTLLEFAPNPGEVHVDEPLRALLRSLDVGLAGALALVSGRSIVDIDDLFEPLFLAVAGVHGCERRDAQGHWRRPAFQEPQFAELRDRVGSAIAPLDGVLLEDKGYAVALHFRMAPQVEAPLRIALGELTAILPESLEIIDGDHVIEIKPASHDKGSAVEAFMQEAPFAGRRPIFIGDDLTDQDAFAAVRRHGGIAVAVGDNVKADYHLRNPTEVRHWLATMLHGWK